MELCRCPDLPRCPGDKAEFYTYVGRSIAEQDRNDKKYFLEHSDTLLKVGELMLDWNVARDSTRELYLKLTSVIQVIIIFDWLIVINTFSKVLEKLKQV